MIGYGTKRIVLLQHIKIGNKLNLSKDGLKKCSTNNLGLLIKRTSMTKFDKINHLKLIETNY